MNAWHRERILGWICTGRHVVEADYVKPPDGSSNSVPFDEQRQKQKKNINNSNRAAQPVPDASPPSSTRSRSKSRSRSSSSASSSSSPVLDRLIGVDDDGDDDDLLIPPSATIDRVFRDGRATWTAFLKRANSHPAHVFPAGGVGDPSIMLKHVPALPAHLPHHGHIAGRPLWHVPDPDHHEGDTTAVQGLDL
ncbi:hypothetical protein B0T24DRAFT_23179 [Lasiosphaeria ovina]|uniref:Uncharacterized protein n=1 Tax=Lasiosphaeria ovina TaxID=92902 RepID=A0AAE0NJR8_9PEZI|nr:hypothetical protein B0T24DRAFT_23179 [Lasiosphaeria ovina]